MAVREISTRLTLTGENSFDNALKAINRNLRQMSAEMDQAKVKFDDADQRQKKLAASLALANQLEQQKNKVQLLEQQLQAASTAWGENDQRVARVRLALTKANTEMIKTQKALDGVNDELRDLRNPLRRTGNDIEENLTDKAREAGTELDSMLGGFGGGLGGLKFSAGISAMRDAADMISSIWQGAEGMTSGTRDYRRQMAYLAQNARTAGEEFRFVQNQAMQVAALTGDMEGAVEGISNLLAAGYKGDSLVHMVKQLSAAAITWPETLKFENLAESLQETVATGKATGAFGEMLERMGYDLENFNAAMEKSDTMLGKYQDVAAFLGATNLEQIYKDFVDNNATLLAEAMADEKWQAAMAGIGEQISVYTTPLKTEMADVILAWGDTLAGKDGARQRLENEMEDVGKLVDDWANDIWQKVSGTKTDAEEQFKKNTPGAGNALYRLITGKSVVAGEKTLNWGQDIFGPIQTRIDRYKEAATLDVSKTMYNIMQKAEKDYQPQPRTTENWYDRIFPKVRGVTGYAKNNATETIANIQKSLKELAAEGEPTGIKTATDLAAGITAQAPVIDAAMAGIVAGINAQIDQVRPIVIRTQYENGSGGKGGSPISLSIDGVTFGRVVTPYVERQMGQNTIRKITVP